MDGVPMVTQCPIGYGQTFKYAFVATSPGTFFYHADSGIQIKCYFAFINSFMIHKCFMSMRGEVFTTFTVSQRYVKLFFFMY